MKYIFIFIFVTIKIVGQELIPFTDKNLWGFKDIEGNIIIKPEYNYAQKFKGNYSVVSKNDSLGLIDKSNNLIIPYKYQLIENIDDNFLLFGFHAKYFGEYKYGITNLKNQIIIDSNFHYIQLQNNFFKVTINKDSIIKSGRMGDLRTSNSKYGLFNTTGKQIIEAKYGSLDFVGDSLIVLSYNIYVEDAKHALFNIEGKQLTEFKYSYINKISEGLLPASKNNLYGFIDKNGKEIIPFKFDYASNFLNGYSCVRKNEKYGIIDKKGVIRIGYIYDNINQNQIKKSIFLAEKNKKWGIINSVNKIIIPFIYDINPNNKSTMLSFKHGNKWRIFNKTNLKLNQEFYDEIENLNYGATSFWDKNQSLEKEYVNSFIKVRIGNFWGLVDENGKQIIKINFSKENLWSRIKALDQNVLKHY